MNEQVLVDCLPVGILRTCCYIVRAPGSGICAVIDPGNEAERIRDKLRELGLSCGAILLTHGHFDHIGAVDALADGGIPVYLHAEDLCMLRDGEKNGSAYFRLPPVLSLAEVTPIAEGDCVTAGDLTFEVLHTPGHSRGSVCYRCGDCLFTGDTLFQNGYGRTDLYGGDFGALKESLRRLLPLSRGLGVCPGHGE